MPTPDHWLIWALLSAVFAALTAVLAKLRVGRDSREKQPNPL